MNRDLATLAVASLLALGAISPPEAEAAAAAAPEPCCGRFAAGALGFAGGYLIGHHRHGCGGCGGGCGWCGGGWYGRKRRSLDEVMDEDTLEEMYWKIASKDSDQCGLRLVCELAQKDPRELEDDEIVFLLPYRGREESDETTSFGKYDKAVWHGQEGNPCHKIYPLCVFPNAEILLHLRTNATLALD
ncbi:uncharacterized protein LOC119577047 [Penaeus monodon]|uniref:uncharacterized protein LOC119577047 n=1 Tax=Penaeus monodon TaxID=6687 RepID=UPI0018A7D4E4|nr:uncharacterized protein LOC119577047 [Penaeus monodon]